MDYDDDTPPTKQVEGYRKMLDEDKARERKQAEEYSKTLAEDKARERKQIADVTREERAYRRANNIPLDPKTHPGYHHMKTPSGGKGGGGGGTPLGRDNVIHSMNPLKLASGGKVVSASSRADGMASRGKTRGKMC